MILLLQRVREAGVSVAGERIAGIGRGILVFAGFEPGDDEAICERLATRLLNYRLFDDDQGRMNLSVRDTGGELLLVPQFTLAADTRKGNRPGFSTAAPPALGEALFDFLCRIVKRQYPRIARGRFGACMQVALVNDGPVTFWLQQSKTG